MQVLGFDARLRLSRPILPEAPAAACVGLGLSSDWKFSACGMSQLAVEQTARDRVGSHGNILLRKRPHPSHPNPTKMIFGIFRRQDPEPMDRADVPSRAGTTPIVWMWLNLLHPNRAFVPGPLFSLKPSILSIPTVCGITS
jgi:hypothetical protein